MRRRAGFILTVLLGTGCAAESPARSGHAPPLSIERVTSTTDGVALVWLHSSKSISQWTIERRSLGDGVWTLLATLPGSAQTYQDRDAEPGAWYRYRVTGHLAEGATTSVETADPVNGPPRWKLTFSNPSRLPDASQGMAYVRIEKFEKGRGKVEARHVHMDGERIGFWEDPPGAHQTSVHRVHLPGGQSIVVDFDTGAWLISIVPVQPIVPFKRCKPIFEMESGRRIDCDIILERRKFDAHRISYLDPEGRHEVTVPDPAVLNQLCERHQEPPKATSRETRLREALNLLDQADLLWPVDSAASSRLYERLLKNYRDLVVPLQARSRVQERARQAEDR